MAANVHLDFYQQPRRRQPEVMAVNGTIIVEFAGWDKATISWYNTVKNYSLKKVPIHTEALFNQN